MGDFNYPAIDFNNYTVNASDDSKYRFCDKLRDLYLVQMVTEPTRFRFSQTPSMLDCVITIEENVINSPGIKRLHVFELEDDDCKGI